MAVQRGGSRLVNVELTGIRRTWLSEDGGSAGSTRPLTVTQVTGNATVLFWVEVDFE